MHGNRFLVLFYNRLYQFQLLAFETVIFNQLHWKYVKLCLVPILKHMDMNWSVVVCIKQETVAKKYEYRRHIIIILRKNR